MDTRARSVFELGDVVQHRDGAALVLGSLWLEPTATGTAWLINDDDPADAVLLGNDPQDTEEQVLCEALGLLLGAQLQPQALAA